MVEVDLEMSIRDLALLSQVRLVHDSFVHSPQLL